MTTDFRAELQALLTAIENDVIDTNDGPRFQEAVDRAGAALAEPEPEGQPPAEPVAWMYRGEPDFDGTAWRENWEVTTSHQLAVFKAQPNQPVPLVRAAQAAAGEVAELVAWLRENAKDEREMSNGENLASLNLDRAADLLERLSPPQPVPVSERLPGPEDCDAWRCYWGRQVNSRRWSWTFSCDPQGGDTHWLPASTQTLPAHALPCPTNPSNND